MRKLYCLIVLIVVLGFTISGCIIPVVPPSGQDESIDIVKDAVSYKTNLIAGQHTIAGYITVSNDDENLFVAYETVDNWLINETHLYVGTTIPTKSAPGKFPYKHEKLGGVETDLYEIPLENLGIGPCDKIYIAAHADLIDGTVAETGWAEGIKITLGKNWAMYFEYDIPCDFMISRMAISQFLEYSEDYGEEQARQMTVDWLKIQSEVEGAGIGEDGTTIWFEYKNGGIEAIFTHDVTQKKTTLEKINGLKLILPKELFSTSNRVIPLSKKAISLDPFTSIFSNSAQTIRNKLLDIGYICGYEENAGVTVELMRNLFKYGVVFINTHAGLIKNSQVVMATGQEYDEAFSEIYKEEFKSGDLVKIWIRGFWKKKPYFGITPSFIQNNAYELYPRTLIYIDACNSLKNTTMAEAFISEGAYTYCGWSTYTWAFDESEEKVFENLADKKMNIQEALNDVGNPYLLFYPSSGWNFCLIKNTVSNVVAISWTDHIPENSQNIVHLINVFWDPYPEANSYKVYRSVNGVVEGEPVYNGSGELLYDKNVVQWHDTNIVVRNTYSYYVTAYGDGWETAPSQETRTINSFLPPIYLVSLSDGETINNSAPTFEWSPVGSNPGGGINFGTTELWVKDLTDDKVIWNISFNDMTTSNATYNQDGQASPLILGHSYAWEVTSYGYVDDIQVAISQSEYWEFTYSDYVVTTPPGDGTSSNPYQIATLENLYWIAEDASRWDKHYIQIANIDASETSGWFGGAGWTPIGNNNDTRFTGSYDGNGHTIDGLYINRPDSSCQGLFGYTNGATISNLGVTNVNITGIASVGGLVGATYSSTVSNSYSTGSVSGNSSVGGLVGYVTYLSTISNSYSTGSVNGTWFVGGLVGYATPSTTISNCYSTGSVSGYSDVGGLVGRNYGSSMSNCYSTGSISGTGYVGGLVGSNEYSTVSNCYSTGSVTGTGSYSHVGGLVGSNDYSTVSNSYSTGSVTGTGNYVGGLVGNNYGSTVSNSYSTGGVTGTGSYVGGLVGDNGYNSTVSNCYSTGSVIGTGNYVGGLVGNNYGSTVSNCYWDMETSGQTTSDGGEGRTTAQMTYPYAANTYVEWNFTGIWVTDQNYNVNNGYPYLFWQ